MQRYDGNHRSLIVLNTEPAAAEQSNGEGKNPEKKVGFPKLPLNSTFCSLPAFTLKFFSLYLKKNNQLDANLWHIESKDYLFFVENLGMRDSVHKI